MKYNLPTYVNKNTFDGVRIRVKVNRQAIDLTNAVIDMIVQIPGSPMLLSTTNNKISIINPPTDGIMEINKQILSFPRFGTFPYEITYRLSNGTVKTYVTGTWTIAKTVE